MAEHQEHSTDCADRCASCHTTCVRALAHCLKQGGAHADASHLQLLQDCIAICQVCSDMCAREQIFAVRFALFAPKRAFGVLKAATKSTMPK